jgi:UDP-N-acetylmuramoyl-tripeptide--D-alanyl-D-alanine ligase
MFREYMLKEIVQMIDGTSSVPGQELVRGVSINSKSTKPGHLFFALKGSHTDGHYYTEDALQHGATAVVVERTRHGQKEIRVGDTLFALGELARKYREQFRVKTIGITGTNGKTTVKNLIGAMLQKCSIVLYTEKNYNSLIGLPLTILRLSGAEEYLIVEMGTNRPGEIKRLCDIAHPDFGLITNVGPGHLEGLGSIDGILKEKLALIDALPDKSKAVVGEGIDISSRRGLFRFSTDMLQDIEMTEHGSSFSYERNTYRTKLLGKGNVYNCLAAICLATQLGIDHEMQRAAIAEMEPEPGRMEPIPLRGVLVINDTYNANPVSMKAAIDFIARSQRRKIMVLGGMLELGEQSVMFHESIGAYARETADLLFTLGTEAKRYGGTHFTEESKLVRCLVENIAGDEIILVKASRALRFERVVSALGRLLR